MDKDRKCEIHITNNFNAPIGQHIDHVDTIQFRMDGEGTFHFGMVGDVCVEKEDEEKGTEEVVRRLVPIFYGDEDEARAFVDCIRGMRPRQVTERVNQLVRERKISDASKHRRLWEVLSGAGLYGKSESNWNSQVK
ncbi:MAG: hypothetical protein IJ635_09360 [Bacteroidaceae bacterium]|nr:hypothetical protein [Bacteroidaceae bacterium]